MKLNPYLLFDGKCEEAFKSYQKILGGEAALGVLERKLSAKTWATGDSFTMADCAAAPSLFYANLMMPFDEDCTQTAAYLHRLMQRPSFARCIEDAKPYRHLFPIKDADWRFAEAEASFAS
jgi:Glutathione S-transferase, C-terminal domain